MSDPCEEQTTCDKVKAIRKWTPEEKQALRALAKWSLEQWPTLYHAFNILTRQLVRAPGTENYDWHSLLVFEQHLAALSAEGKHREACVDFAERLILETDKFLPACQEPDYLKLKEELVLFKAPTTSR